MKKLISLILVFCMAVMLVPALPDFASIKMRNPKPANGLGYKSPK